MEVVCYWPQAHLGLIMIKIQEKETCLHGNPLLVFTFNESYNLISYLTLSYAFQIWYHYDIDKSGYLEGAEIEVYLIN